MYFKNLKANFTKLKFPKLKYFIKILYNFKMAI